MTNIMKWCKICKPQDSKFNQIFSKPIGKDTILGYTLFVAAFVILKIWLLYQVLRFLTSQI